MLGMLQRLRIRNRLSKQRTGIGHASVKPCLIKVVAQIIMEFDIAPRAASAVTAQRVHDRAHQLREPGRPPDIAQRHPVAHEKVEYLHRIGAAPFARRPGFVPARRAATRQPQQRPPVMQCCDCDWTRPRPPSRRVEPSGKMPSMLPYSKPAIDAIQYRMKAACKKAASERAQTGCACQMAASIGIGSIHGKRLCYTLPRFAITCYFLRNSSRISVSRSTSVGPAAGGGMILFA